MTPATDEVQGTAALLAHLLRITEEQLHWQRAAAIPQVRVTIEAALATTKERKAFELCDGERTSTEIGKSVGVPKATLSGWTRNWRNLGIANEVATGKGTRIKRLISLAALGISVEAKGSAG
jgi:hypothetical protein